MHWNAKTFKKHKVFALECENFLIYFNSFHDKIIKKFNLIDGDYIVDNKKRKEEYTKLLKSGDLEDLIYLIKILEKLFKDKKHVNKAIGTIDSSLYNEAKNKLYQELSYVLDMNYDAIDSLLNNR